MKDLKQTDFNIKIIKDLGMQYATEKSKTRSRFGIFECGQCGKHIRKQIQSVKNGSTLCGTCRAVNRNTTHNMSNTKYYFRWNNMKNRCFNVKDKHFIDYGGRGISVCDEWVKDFQSYYDYISTLDNAFRDNYTIDRIDNDGNYEYGNLRWATSTEQNFNKRTQKTTQLEYKEYILTKNIKILYQE